MNFFTELYMAFSRSPLVHSLSYTNIFTFYVYKLWKWSGTVFQCSAFQLEEIFLPQGHVTMSGEIWGKLLTDI